VLKKYEDHSIEDPTMEDFLEELEIPASE